MTIQADSASQASGLRISGGDKGFQNDALAHINQIKDNLRDRYQNGFPVVKELLQNADDGRASRFWLVRSEGLAQAQHPWLRGPALLVLNNGTFRQTDQEGIRQLGLSHRIGEEKTIGKFGLGLKSVFHLCEMFFFGASAVLSKDGRVLERELLEILNPWSTLKGKYGEAFRRWNQLTNQDAELILTRVRTIAADQQWFFLWVPLRQKQICPSDRKGPLSISTSFPGDDPEQEFARWWPNLADELAGLLPFLRQLEEVTLGAWTSGFTSTSTLKLTGGSVRSVFPNLEAEQPREMGGSISFGQDDSLCYAGVESLSGAPVFRDLKEGSKWPTQAALTIDDDDPIQCQDKNKPHAAVYLTYRSQTGREAEASNLRIIRSTFLPVGEPLGIHLAPIPARVDVYLHGFFFVDSGRSHVDTGDVDALLAYSQVVDERSLYTFWNQELEHHGTLPLLPSALAALVRKAALDFDHACAITRALYANSYLQARARWIPQRHCWQCQFLPEVGQDDGLDIIVSTQSQGRRLGWVLDSRMKHTPIRFPEAKSVPALLETFPGLERLTATATVLVPGMPSWTRAEPRASLTSQELGQLLPTDFSAYTSQLLDRRSKGADPDERFRILLGLLSNSVAEARARVHETCRGLGKALFRYLGGAKRGEAERVLRAILSLLPCEEVWPVDLRSASRQKASELLDQVNQLSLSRIVVLQELVPEDGLYSSLPDADAEQILQELSGSEPSPLTDALIGSVLKSSGSERGVLLQRCKDLALFQSYVFDPERAGGLARRASLSEIRAVQQRGLLFVRHDIHHAMEGALIQALCPEEGVPRIITLPRESAETVFDALTIPGPCAADTVLKALSAGLRFHSDPARRRSLLALVCEQPPLEGSSSWMLARALFHGRSEALEDHTTLWWSSESSDLWEGIGRKVLQQTQEEWKFVARGLSETVAPNVLTKLKVWGLGPTKIEKMLTRMVGEGHDFSGVFGALECEALAERLDDEQTAACLPIHATLDGRWVARSDFTYLASEGQESLSQDDGPVLIRVSDNPRIQARQRRIFPEFDSLARLEMLLRDPSPFSNAERIMDLLDSADRAADDRDRASRLQVFLTQTDWLPTIDGHAIRPTRIRTLWLWDDHLEHLMAILRMEGRTVDVLPPALCEHRNWDRLERLFTPPLETVREMADLVEREHLRLGIGDCLALAERWPVLRERLLELPGALCPAAGLIKALLGHMKGPEGTQELSARRTRRPNSAEVKEAAETLFRSFCQSTDIARIARLLSWAQDEHRNAKAERRVALEAYFDLLLAELAKSSRLEEKLQGMELLNQEDQWCSTARLCLAAENNVHPKACLKDSQSRILAPYLSVRNQEVTTDDICSEQVLDSTKLGRARFFELLFEGWDGREIVPETLGGFVALFSVFDPTLTERVTKWLDNRATKLVTEGLGIGRGQDWRINHRVAGESEQPYTFEIHGLAVQPDKVAVPALSGVLFQAPIKTELESLLLGKIPPPAVDRSRKHLIWWIKLARIDPLQYEAKQLQHLLWQTASRILISCHLYGLHSGRDGAVSKASEFWQASLEQSKQLDITVAQRGLRTALTVLFQQMSPTAEEKKSWRLSGEIRKYHELRRQLAELEVTASKSAADIPLVVRQVSQSQQAVLEQIGQLLEGDSETHVRLLTLVRRKIENHFQYQAESVAFELFQNADDAVSDLLLLPGDEERADRGLFDLEETEVRLLVRNTGRGVNQFQSSGGQENPEHTARFKSDLENMLTLHASDKGMTSEGGPAMQTGKFGLGFKSVFLVSDHVRVISKRLAFEIVGGFYPRLMKEALTAWLPGGPGTTGETLISLERPRGTRFLDAWRRVFPAFRRQADIQVVFSRRIRQVRLKGLDADVTTFHWQPSQLCQELPQFQFGYRPSEPGGRQFLVLETRHGKLLFALSGTGLQPLEPDYKRIWVTTPLNEPASLDFAVCADFEPDVGRGQLAIERDANRRLARALGQEAGRMLAGLVAYAEANWDSLRERLRLSEACPCDNFKSSVWTVAAGSNPTPDSARETLELLRTSLLKELETAPVIPTGLWGRYQSPLSRRQIREKVVGLLSLQSIFLSCSNLFEQGQIPPGAIHYTVADGLPDVSTLPELRLGGLLERLVRDEKLSPAQAIVLAEPLAYEPLARYRNTYSQELPALSAQILALTVKSRAGTWERLQHLVVRDDSTSSLVAGFAPTKRLLSEEYEPSAVRFLQGWLRDESLPHFSTLASWVLELDSADTARQGEALRFVLAESSELGAATTRAIADGLFDTPDCWLHDCDFRSLGFSQKEAQELVRLLIAPQRLKGSTFLEELTQPATRRPATRSPAQRLKALKDWWAAHGSRALADYDRKLYPRSSISWARMADEDDPDEVSWLTFLMFCTLQRLGRQTDGQHREFVQEWHARGWFDCLLRVDRERAEIVNVLDQYFDDKPDQEYFQWLGFLPAFYQLSRWREDYIHRFLQLNDVECKVRRVLSARSDPSARGSYDNAPNLKATLGIGVCFAFRELVRHRVIVNPNLARFCYVPNSVVRETATQLLDLELNDGLDRLDQSEAIFMRLRQLGPEISDSFDPTFGGSFDLPLRLCPKEVLGTF